MHLHTSIFPKKGRGGKAGRHSGREQLSIIIRFRSVLKCRNGNEVRAHKLSVEFFQTALSPFPHFPPTGTQQIERLIGFYLISVAQGFS